jgi:hypothetical protein
MKVARRSIVGLLSILALICAMAPARAQEKPSGGAEAKKLTPLKVVVVVTELDGSKKISNMPYSFFVNADDNGGRPMSQVRVGLRVPIVTGTGAGDHPAQMQYMDIGTNIDCSASTSADGRFKLVLSIDRSYLSSADEKKTATLAGDGVSVSSVNPIIQHFSSSYDLLIHDGQTIEATSTTDPISGRVLQISVTVNTVK